MITGLRRSESTLSEVTFWRIEDIHIDPLAGGRWNGVKMGRPPKLTPHEKEEAIRRRDHGEETLAEIGRSYNVSE